jgi:hypothetical protein
MTEQIDTDVLVAGAAGITHIVLGPSYRAEVLHDPRFGSA